MKMLNVDVRISKPACCKQAWRRESRQQRKMLPVEVQLLQNIHCSQQCIASQLLMRRQRSGAGKMKVGGGGGVWEGAGGLEQGGGRQMKESVAYFNSGVHDEAGDMYGAGLAHAVRPPHRLLQDGRVHAGLQQKHVVSCTIHILPSA